MRHRAFPRDAPRFIDEIRSEPSLPDASAKASANKFRWSVLKMRETLTFLATFKTNHRGHENTGRHIDPGAAHHFGGRLYRSVAGLGSAYRAAGELTPAVGAGVGDKGANDAFGGSASQAHQRASGSAGFPYCGAGLGRLIAESRCGLKAFGHCPVSVVDLPIWRRQAREIW